MEYNIENMDKLSESGIKEVTVDYYAELNELRDNPDFVIIKGPICHARYKNIEINIKNNIPNWSFIEVKMNDRKYINYVMSCLKKNEDLVKNLGLIILSIKDKEIRFDIKNKEIDKITFPKIDNLNEVDDILSSLDNNNINYNSVKVKMYNKTYDGLEDMCLKYNSKNILCNYGDPIDATLDDFTSMRSTIDYFKSIIPDDLSPLEKAMLMFDEVKSFSYKESDADLDNSRYIPNIVKTGNIVCAGYAAFLVELMEEEGIKAESMSAEIIDGKAVYGHARVLVKLDDPKYDLHGIFICDPTWDSKKDNLAEVKINDKVYLSRFNDENKNNTENKDVVNKYDVMSDYRFFMIPIDEFDDQFKGENHTNFIKSIKDSNLEEELEKINNGNKDNILFYNTIKHFFEDNVKKEEVEKYVHTKRISYEDFIKCLHIVKQSEGYSTETEKTVREGTKIRANYDSVSSNKEELERMLANEFKKEKENKKKI